MFHVCVRIHIDISDIRRDRRGADEQGRAGRASRSASGSRAARGQPRASGRAQARGVWLWVATGVGPPRLRVSRALRPTSLAARGPGRVYRVSKRPPYSYAIVTLTGFISPFVGPATRTYIRPYLPLGGRDCGGRLGISEWRPRPPFGGRAADASVSARSDLRRYEHRLRCDGRVALAPRD